MLLWLETDGTPIESTFCQWRVDVILCCKQTGADIHNSQSSTLSLRNLQRIDFLCSHFCFVFVACENAFDNILQVLP